MSDAAIGPKFTQLQGACSCTSGTYNSQCQIEHHRHIAFSIAARAAQESHAATGPLIDRLTESHRALHMAVWELLKEFKRHRLGYVPSRNSTLGKLAAMVCFDWTEP